jgi:ACR3 family arsenite efflux pump ArsB
MVLVQILGVTDTAIVAGMVMVAAAPMGMTSLSYGLISGLDTQVLASAISISILLGLFWLPVLAFFLGGS